MGWGPRCPALPQALISPAASHDLTLTGSTLCPRVKFWSPGGGRGRNSSQRLGVCDGFGEKTEGFSSDPPPKQFLVQGTPRDQNFCPRPAPLAVSRGPCTCECPVSHGSSWPLPLITSSMRLPLSLPLSSGLSSSAPPWLLPPPPPPPCWLSLSCPSRTPHPPRPHSPRAGVEECVFCFSPVPALPPPPADQERAELAAGRRHLEARQALYAELQTQVDNCPESVREQLQEQLRRVSFTSPPSLAPRATHPEERRAVGRDHLGPAVPAGHQGWCCGLEGTGQDGGSASLLSVTPGVEAPCKGQSQGEERGLGGVRSLPRFPWGQPSELPPLWPGLPGPELYPAHHLTPSVTVVQGGRGPGDRDKAVRGLRVPAAGAGKPSGGGAGAGGPGAAQEPGRASPQHHQEEGVFRSILWGEGHLRARLGGWWPTNWIPADDPL